VRVLGKNRRGQIDNVAVSQEADPWPDGRRGGRFGHALSRVSETKNCLVIVS
jgi:hypothetical protein